MSPTISARGSHGKSGRPPRRGATAGPQGGAVPPAPSLLLPGPGSLGHPSKWRFCAQCSSAVWFPGERLPASGAGEPCLCSRIFHPHHPPTWFCGIGFPRAALPPHRMVGGCTRGSCVPQLVLTLTPPHTHAASLTSINGGCCVSPSPPPYPASSTWVSRGTSVALCSPRTSQRTPLHPTASPNIPWPRPPAWGCRREAGSVLPALLILSADARPAGRSPGPAPNVLGVFTAAPATRSGRPPHLGGPSPPLAPTCSMTPHTVSHHLTPLPAASRGFPVSRGEAGVFTVACEAPHNQVPACPLSLAHRAPATLGLLLFQHSRHSELRSDVTSSEKPSLTITSSKQPHECFPFVRPPCPELPHETADFLRAATWGSFCSLARSRRSGCSANTRPSFFSSGLQ